MLTDVKSELAVCFKNPPPLPNTNAVGQWRPQFIGGLLEGKSFSSRMVPAPPLPTNPKYYKDRGHILASVPGTSWVLTKKLKVECSLRLPRTPLGVKPRTHFVGEVPGSHSEPGIQLPERRTHSPGPAEYLSSLLNGSYFLGPKMVPTGTGNWYPHPPPLN